MPATAVTLDNRKPLIKKEFTSELLAGSEYIQYVESTRNKFSAKQIRQLAVGQTHDFFVRNLFNQSHWDSVEATLVFDTTKISIWIETAALDTIVYEEQKSTIIQLYRDYLFTKSGQYSVDSTKGILDILHMYFGNPPDIDNDNKLDLLILDIKDGFESTGSYVAGFFDPNDLTNSETSNKRDLIYLDLYPSIMYNDTITVSRSIPTFAHEYQHLIHANYEGTTREYIFVNEGLSELAEIVCGFNPRLPDDHLNNTGRSLLSWTFSDPLPDYARASLWTHYLFEQIGYDKIKYLVQSPEIGQNDYDILCRDYLNTSFGAKVKDWQIALTINDISINPKYGYQHPLRKELDSTPVIGSQNNIPFATTRFLGKLGYTKITEPYMKELRVAFNASEIISIGYSVNPQGQKEYLGETNLVLTESTYGSAGYIIMNENLPENEEDNSKEKIDLLVSGKKSGFVELLQYDDGYSDVFFNQASFFLLEGDEAIAIRFQVDEPILIESVEIDAIFLNEVLGTGISQVEPRDIEIQIVTDAGGKPGDAITPLHYHRFTRPLGNLKTEKIFLGEYFDYLNNIDQDFYLVIRNDPDDVNYFAIGLDSTHSETETQIYSTLTGSPGFSWQTLGDIQVGSEFLEGWNAMGRTTIIHGIDYTRELINITIDNNFDEVNISCEFPFEPDTVSQLLCQMPSGRNVPGKIKIINNTLSSSFPIEIDGSYTFYLHGYNTNEKAAIDTVFSWDIPLPSGLMLSTLFPNPFNSVVTVPFRLLETGNVSISIYNLLGQEIYSGRYYALNPGLYMKRINMDKNSSGIYFALLEYTRTRDNEKTRKMQKMLLVK